MFSNTHHPTRPAQGECFELRGDPEKRKGLCFVDPRYAPHIAVDRQQIFSAGKNSCNGAFALGALAMDEIGLKPVEKTAHGAGASKIAGSQPAHFGNDQRMIKKISPDFRGRINRSLDARNNVNLDSGKFFETG
jgi:hypothetical protein